jgi:hypothetical protein
MLKRCLSCPSSLLMPISQGSKACDDFPAFPHNPPSETTHERPNYPYDLHYDPAKLRPHPISASEPEMDSHEYEGLKSSIKA